MYKNCTISDNRNVLLLFRLRRTQISLQCLGFCHNENFCIRVLGLYIWHEAQPYYFHYIDDIATLFAMAGVQYKRSIIWNAAINRQIQKPKRIHMIALVNVVYDNVTFVKHYHMR